MTQYFGVNEKYIDALIKDIKTRSIEIEKEYRKIILNLKVSGYDC
jgi:hypothetical protein